MAGQLVSCNQRLIYRWLTQRPNRRRIRVMHKVTRIWLAYGILTLAAIPWYWRWIPGATTLICGVPAWAASAIVGSALVSCYTAWLLSRRWPEELSGEGDQ